MVLTSNEQTVRTGFWPKLARVFAAIPFAEDALAAYYCAFDRATPLKVKGVLLGALAYFVLPLDAVPDFLLGLGFTDDMAVLLTAIGMIRGHLRPEHYERARATLERLKRGERFAE
ncbi:MAG: YkvA family protein [Parvibaculaceae bacterium]